MWKRSEKKIRRKESYTREKKRSEVRKRGERREEYFNGAWKRI